jgi:hypothetical protein
MHFIRRRSGHAAVWVAYVLSCASIVLAGTMLSVSGPVSLPVDLQSAQPKAAEIPVARIQFVPDRNNLCRALLFHNDSGRYQDAGMGKCIFPEDGLVWTVRTRAEAFSKAFQSSWKGDSLPSSLH